MKRQLLATGLIALGIAAGSVAISPRAAATQEGAGWQKTSSETVLSAQAAFGDWMRDRPGLRRSITPADLPAPSTTRSAENSPEITQAQPGVKPSAPPGFSVEPFLSGLTGPRLMRRAPNGDIFVSQGTSGRVMTLRAADGASHPERIEVFARNLRAPFGIAFYPLGGHPQWVYVAEADSIVRFPYVEGDLVARGAPERIVDKLPIVEGGHWTRDLAFSADGSAMYVSIGARGNDGEDMHPPSAKRLAQFISGHALGAAWGRELNRASVMVFDPQGGAGRLFATGLRNCVGLAIHPHTGGLWCAVNERDGLGDDLPPDFVTRIRDGGFYGWPWYYIGGNEDPQHLNERPDLAGKVTVPDVLLQPHSVPLGITLYELEQGGAAAFPDDYRDNLFVALHGSWNRARRTGYKVVRIKMNQGIPNGEYEDFLTGFVADSAHATGRPVGVCVARDGALLVSEDGNGMIWRVAWQGEHVGGGR